MEKIYIDLYHKIPYVIYAKVGDRIMRLGTNTLLDFGADVKPFLRPISSLTKEECDHIFSLLGITEEGGNWVKINDLLGIKFIFPEGVWIEDLIKVYDYLDQIHVDYRGLIEDGLAIEAVGENDVYSSKRTCNLCRKFRSKDPHGFLGKCLLKKVNLEYKEYKERALNCDSFSKNSII